MMNLLCFLCSLCIQLGAFGIPYEMTYDDFTLGLMQTFEVQAHSSEDPRILYFADMWKTGEVQYFLFNGNNGNYEIWYDASKYNSSYTSTVVGRIEDNTNSYLQLQLTFKRYYRIVFNPNYTSTLSCSFPNDYGWDDYVFCRVYPYTQDSYKYLYMVNGVVNNESGTPIIYGNYVFTEPVEPETPTFGNLGALDSSGHSSGASPFESIKNSSINWGSVTGHSNGGAIAPSPHSSSTHFISTTPSPNSNDSKTDSLLYMLGNKLADITENTGAISSALGGIMYNQAQGVSALFNAISGFNDNFVSAFTPPGKEEFSAVLQTSEIYTSYQNVSSSVSAMTTTLNSVGQQNGYIWEITLPETWGGNLSFNFSNYLDTNSLNFIRILIGAILIISTIVFVAHQFPDIIGGGSGGENA